MKTTSRLRTQINRIKPGGLRRAPGILALSALFAAGDTGLATVFEPGNGVFQDFIGTAASIPNDPLGFVLDQSKPITYGPELVTNQTFDAATGWNVNAGWTVAGGVATFNAGTGNALTTAGIAFGQWKWYRIEFDLIPIGSITVTPQISGTGADNAQAITSGGHKVVHILVTATTRNILSFSAVGGSNFAIDNVSCREVIGGRHLTQTNLGLMPRLGRAPISRRNLAINSETIGGGVGVTYATNSMRAPDGSMTMDKAVEDTSSGQHYINYSYPAVLGETRRISHYLKAGERAIVNTFGSGGAGVVASRIDLSTGTVLSGPATCEPIGNGVYRVSYTATATATGNQLAYVQIMTGQPLTGTYLGDGASGFYAWGFQAEPGTVTTPYQRVGASSLDMIEPILGGSATQRNLLTETENIAAWSGNARTGKNYVDFDGKITAEITATGADMYVFRGAWMDAGDKVARVLVRGRGASIGKTVRAWFWPVGGPPNSILSANPVSTITLTGSWQILTASATVTTPGAAVLRIDTGATSAVGDVLELREPQINHGTTLDPYERVGATWEPPQAAASLPFARPDGLDDEWIVNLTSTITDGTMILAGRNGCIVETFSKSAGDMWLGRNAGTYLGSALMGALKGVGDLVGILAISRQLSPAEKADALRYFQQRGAGGELAEGANVLGNTWTPQAGITQETINGRLRLTSTVATGTLGSTQTATTAPRRVYIMRGTALRLDANSTAAQGVLFETPPTTAQIGGAPGGSSGSTGTPNSANLVFVATDFDVSVQVRIAGIAAIGAAAEFYDYSIKELNPLPLVA